MIGLLATTETDRICARALIESDRRYFEMGAIVQSLSLGDLVWMRGLTDLAASCVIHRVDGRIPHSWIDEIELALAERSIMRARVYLDDSPEDVDALFRQRGYQRRGEIGFLAPVGHPETPANVRLCEVVDDLDWQRKLAIHEQAMEGPDGYTNQADAWVEMERRKCAAGNMQSFLVRCDNHVVATVGAIVHDGLLRLKNIVVAPQFRRRGLGLATVHLLWQMAEREHDCRFGVFGVDGGRGERLYQRAGMYQVVHQYEWSRLLTGPKPR